MEIQQISRQAVEASAVLLKNQDMLPLAPGKQVAFFGWAQWDPVLSGNGSGASHSGRNPSFVESCREAGLEAVPALADFYKQWVEQEKATKAPAMELPQLKEAVNSGLMYELFGKYNPNPQEPAIPQELLEEAAAQTDTALWVLGRRSGGEECDRHLENDFTLSPEEEALLEALCAHFEKVAVVLNTNGLVDLSWVEPHPQVKALLFLGVPGDEGPAAMANLLTGKVNPSGKLSVTIAQKGEDYPAWKDFSWDKDHPENILTYGDYGLEAPASAQAFDKRPVTVYREGIYLGYRYFDSFGVKPLYPFGFGLSYTTFSLRAAAVEKGDSGLRVRALVENTGSCPGKEVAQLYLSACGTQQEHPFQELKAFAKTRQLAPGEGETLTLDVPWRELASYVEEAALGSSRRAPTWCGWGTPPRPPRWWAPSRYRRTLWCPRARALWPWTPRPGRRWTGSPASPPRCRNSPRIAWCFPWLPVKCRPALCLPCRWWTAPPSPMRSWPACAWALAPACPSPICRRPSCPPPWLGRTAGP